VNFKNQNQERHLKATARKRLLSPTEHGWVSEKSNGLKLTTGFLNIQKWPHKELRNEARLPKLAHMRRLKSTTEMMRPDTGLHANQAGRYIGKPSLNLVT
jgi:hypothetical protein